MKNPAKKISAAIILGATLLDARFSFAQNNEIFYNSETKIYLSEEDDSADRKKEFWEKFRETVKPREKNPREVHPEEIHPEEVHPHEK